MAEKQTEQYSEESIKTLSPKEHIRLRPGMYIGKLGDGSSQDDGIYVLIKEVIDNSIDEFMMGNGKIIDISIEEREVKVRDYGRGIPLGKLVDAVSKMNTGAKYDSKVFKKSVGLNGVGLKAVNALTSKFNIRSIRDGQVKLAEFHQGNLNIDAKLENTEEESGVEITIFNSLLLFSKISFGVVARFNSGFGFPFSSIFFLDNRIPIDVELSNFAQICINIGGLNSNLSFFQLFAH